MNSESLWLEYCRYSGIPIDQKHDCWAFCGGGPVGDELANLVLAGIKTSTASYYESYLAANEPIPDNNAYSVIEYDSGEAACVVKNYDVSIVPFNSVSAYHGFLEGEGDRSLQYWRDVHRVFFNDDENGVSFSENGSAVLEKFICVYPQIETEGLLLIEPSELFSNEIETFRNELQSTGKHEEGAGFLCRAKSVSEWIAYTKELADLSHKPSLAPVHATHLLCLRKSDNKIVGVIQVRHELKEHFVEYGGHVGYTVCPSERKKGYATWMLKQVLPFCKALHLDKVLVTCLETNDASKKTIRKCGGEFERTTYSERDGKNLERYWIKT